MMVLDLPAWAFELATVLSAARLCFAPWFDERTAWLDSREADAVHIVMNGCMALMVAAPLVARAWFHGALAFTLAVLVGRLIFVMREHAPVRSARIAATLYHGVATGAMIWAMTLMHSGPMVGMMRRLDDHQPVHAYFSLPALSASFFAIDAAATTIVALLFPHFIERTLTDPHSLAPASRTRRLSLVSAAIPHVVMDLGMAGMLLG